MNCAACSAFDVASASHWSFARWKAAIMRDEHAMHRVSRHCGSFGQFWADCVGHSASNPNLGLLPMLRCHQHGFKVFEEHWKVLEAESRVRNSFNADRHGLVDIITFAVTCIQYRRRASRRPLSASTWARWRATDYSERHTYTA